MKIKGLIAEDFVNYKKPSMAIMFPSCSFKCDRECGERVCQNRKLAQTCDIEIESGEIVGRYMNNPMTKAMVITGLEPFDDYNDVIDLISCLRGFGCADDVVIYTGYTEHECQKRGFIDPLRVYSPVIVKFGRFIPNQKSRFDEVLGVNLISNNQYAKYI